MLASLALALLIQDPAPAGQAGASLSLACGDTRPLEITAASEAGPRFELRVDALARVYIWSGHGVVLRLEDKGGKLISQDDGGELERKPLLYIELRPEATAYVRSSLREGAAAGRYELNVRCSRESAALREALVESRKVLSGVPKRAKGEARATALTSLRAALDSVFAVEGAEASGESALFAQDLGVLAWSLEDAQLALDACGRAAAVRGRLQPEDHIERLASEFCTGIASGMVGDVERGIELLEHVLAVRERCLKASDPELQSARQQLAVVLSKAGKNERAHRLMRSALAEQERVLQPDDPALRQARLNLAFTLRDSHDLPGARDLFRQVLEAQAGVLPEESPDALQVRWDLAYALRDLGDRAAARAELERIVEITLAHHAEEGPEVQLARLEVGHTLCELGEPEAARALLEAALAVGLKLGQEDAPFFLALRAELAVALKGLAQYERARALEEQVLDVRTATLAEGDPLLDSARINFAASLLYADEFARARGIYEQLEASLRKRTPLDELTLAGVRSNLASALEGLGEREAARALQLEVLEVRLRLLPEEHKDVQEARQNLANGLLGTGQLQAARALYERVLEAHLRRVPAEHFDVQAARINLANALFEQGDLRGARLLQEQALGVLRKSLEPGHTLVLTATENLAITELNMGELEPAREHLQFVLAAREAAGNPDAPFLQTARMNLGIALGQLGEFARARELIEQALASRTRALGAGSPEVQHLRVNLAQVLASQGDRAAAQDLREQALAALTKALAADHPEIQATRKALVNDYVRAERMDRAEPLLKSLVESLQRSWSTAALSASPREVGARVERDLPLLDCILSFAALPDATAAPYRALAFECVETLRGADLVSSALLSVTARDEVLRARRERLTRASERLARGTARSAPANELEDLTRERDAAQSAWVELLAARPAAGAFLLPPTDARLASALGPGRALVAYWRYAREGVGPRLSAFVLRGGGELAWVDLGPVQPVQQAIEDWRRQLAVPLERGVGVGLPADAERSARASGERLRALVFDPLRTALGDASTLVLVLDDWLHAVPLDALPLDGGLLGERFGVQLRASARELVWPPRELPAGGGLLALGGVSFNSLPQEPGVEFAASAPVEEPPPIAANLRPAVLRGSDMALGFRPLSHSAEEVRGLGELYAEVIGRAPVVLEKSAASRPELEKRATATRFLHVATHAWYAPESVPSSADAGLRGLSPMLLCGLALAGANLAPDELGRVSGVVTAEEIASWDLSGCELAVLSACQTHVGVQRAGQGLASLQKALQLAGARSSITSLWRVPDEATKELMLDFYRRLWVKKLPKERALWEAKMAIRAAKDERGRPRYATHDWAAWVLTGDPR